MEKFDFNATLNAMCIVAFSALMIFTPLYQFQRMIFLITIFSLWFLTTISIDRIWYWKKSVLGSILMFFFMIAIDYVLWQVTNDYTYFSQCITHKIFVYLWFVIFMFYVNHTDLLRKIVIIVLMLIGISTIFTLIGNLQNPGASRLLAGTNEYYSSMRAQYRSFFIGGYDFIYGLVFLMLPLMLWVKNRLKGTVFALGVLVLSFITIIISSYFIGILLIFGFFVCTLFKPQNMFRYIITMSLLLLAVILMKDYLLGVLVAIGNAIDSEILVKRANELITMSYVSDYGEGNRLVIYHNAFLNYLDHPFLGTLQGTLGDHRRSGHSALLVYLENYGLLSICYYVFLAKILKNTKSFIYDNALSNLYTIFFAFLLIFMFVDIFDTAYALGCIVFFVSPSILLILDKELSSIGAINEENENTMDY